MTDRTHTQRSTQQALPFADAEALYADNWQTIRNALKRVNADLHLRDFVHIVFDRTAGGGSPSVVFSYEELAEGADWLWCSKSKARSTVERAEHEGFVAVQRRRGRAGSQQPNGYAIDWEGVRAILCGDRPSQRGPHASTEHPHASTEHPHALWQHHIKETTVSSSIDQRRSGSEAGPSPRSVDGKAEKAVAPRAGEADGQDLARLQVLAEIPELREASGRRIDPLPPSKLIYGVYAAIDAHHLRRPLALVEWFRRQLATCAPVCGHTEADLLLVLAAGRYALSLDVAAVRSSRVGVFVSTIRFQRWLKILPYVPEARQECDRMLACAGAELFCSTDWPPVSLRASTIERSP